jgi:Pregnancy-associated plasma protein-A/Secretion system C-terminal sorting domain
VLPVQPDNFPLGVIFAYLAINFRVFFFNLLYLPSILKIQITMKLKITSIITLFLVLTINAGAQVQRCGTSEHMIKMRQNNPLFDKAMQKAEKTMEKYLDKQAPSPSSAQRVQVVVTIPVVVHVVYKTAIQNISDAQIISQIEVLNEDFRRLNADTSNTPSYFQGVAADVEIEFCLAQRDPSGAATNGIVRTLTTVNSFIDDDLVKFDASGGDDAWDVNEYFNIWVCNLGGGLLGYAEFPNGTPSNTYGVVIVYDSFGRVGTVSSPYNLGRTATHEVGHCFNLRHIWGDDGTACTGSDLVADTPNQADENYNCSSAITISCTNGPNGDMYQNYMDYSNDACMNMFTAGQKTRMLAALNAFYPSLTTSLGCVPPTSLALDAGIQSITDPSGTLCSGTITPVVTLRNYGVTTLTSVTINYQVDAGTVNTYSWSGNLVSQASVIVTLPVVTTTGGNHTMTIYTSNPNSSTDGNLTNDSQTSNFNVIANGAALPFSDGIELATFPAPNFTLNNPDASTTWERTPSAFHSGANSMYMDNFDYNANGQIDELVMNPVDLSSVTNPVFSFWLAYQLYTNPTSGTPFSDTLEVLVSTDCGLTYTSLYKKFSTALTTVTPIFSTTEFVPTLASQWRNEIINLAPYATATNAIFKIKHITDFENNLFVDDINIQAATGIQQLDANTLFTLYPNPAKDEISVRLNLFSDGTLRLFNTLGAKVWEENVIAGQNEFRVSLNEFAEGAYTMTLTNAETSVSQRLVIKK